MSRTKLTDQDFQRLHLLSQHALTNAPHQGRFHNFAADFEELFSNPVGHVDQRDDYRSALGPTAYFVDLVRLVAEHIDPPQDSRLALPKRRPDIFEMELSQEKAERIVPYLEIANSVMRSYLEETLQIAPSALEQLAQSRFPFALPFHLPLTQIRTYLQHFGIDLAEVYAAFRLATDDPAWAAETLTLAPGELTYLATADASPKALGDAYGVSVTDTNLGGLDTASTFLAQTGLSQVQLQNLAQMHMCHRLFAQTRTGLFISDDNGTAWQQSGKNQFGSSSVDQLVAIGDRLFACTSNGLFVSDNNGTAWRQTGRDEFWSRQVNQVDVFSNRLFAGTRGGLFVSDDNGTAWQKTGNDQFGSSYVYPLTGIGNRFFASTTGGFFVSDDNGATWQQTGREEIGSRSVEQLAAIGNRLFARTGRLFVSDDNGISWQRIDQDQFGRTAVLQVVAFGNRLFACTGGLFLSDDNGTTWQQTGRDKIGSMQVNQLVNIGSRLFALAISGLFFSDDNGTTWQQTGGEEKSSFEQVAQIIAFGDRLFAQTGAGLFISDDNGSAWRIAGKHEITYRAINQVASIGNRVFVSLDRSGVLADLDKRYGLFVSDDNGTTWQPAGKKEIGSRDVRQVVTTENLTIPALDYLNRFIRLANRLGWSFDDLNWALTSSGATLVKSVDENRADLQRLARIEHLRNRYKLPIDLLCGFHSDLRTKPSFDQPNGYSLFDRIFNTPPFYHGDSRPADEKYAPQSNAITWDSSGASKPDGIDNQKVRASLQGALKVSGAELDAMLDHLFGKRPRNNIELNLSTLTRLYRLSKLAQVLGMAVPGHLALLGLIARKEKAGPAGRYLAEAEVRSIGDALKVAAWADWLTAAGVNAFQLEYLTGAPISDAATRAACPLLTVSAATTAINNYLEQLQELAVRPAAFAHSGVDTALAMSAWHCLVAADLLDSDGLVRQSAAGLNEDAVNTAIGSCLPQSLNGADTRYEEYVRSVVETLREALLRQTEGVTATWSTMLGADITSVRAALTYVAGMDDRATEMPLAPALGRVCRIASGRARGGGTDTISLAAADDAWLEMPIAITAGVGAGQTRTIVGYAGHDKLVTLDLAWETVPDASSRYTILNPSVVERLFLLLYLAKTFALSAQQFQSVIRLAGTFDFTPAAAETGFSLDALRQIADFKQLTLLFERQGDAIDTASALQADTSDPQAKSAEALRCYLQADSSVDAEHDLLYRLSGWDREQIVALAGHLAVMAGISKPHADDEKGTQPTVAGTLLPRTVANLASLQRAFDVAAKLDIHSQLLIDLCNLHTLADETDDRAWNAYVSTAQAFLSVVLSKYTGDDWHKTFDPIRDHLHELERDALADFLLRRLQRKFPDITTRQDLYEFLLVDVEMSGCARTTFIKEAIDCLQVYIQRCRMNLESGIGLKEEIPDAMWDWMGHFRLWQANRKIFLHPENYLDPTLRTREATPEFKALQSELLQGDIDKESVEQAYIRYFDKLDELAGLKIVDGCYARVHNPNSKHVEDNLFLIGRTASEPPIYYQRDAALETKNGALTGAIIGWSPWQKIDVNIPADQALALYTADRLYIFWVEQKSFTERDSTDKKILPPKTLATIKFSNRKVSGRWVQPQTLAKDIDAATLPKPFYFAPGGHQAEGIYLFLSRQADAVGNTPQAVLSLILPAASTTLSPLTSSLLPNSTGSNVSVTPITALPIEYATGWEPIENIVSTVATTDPNYRSLLQSLSFGADHVNQFTYIGNRRFACTEYGLFFADRDNNTGYVQDPTIGAKSVNRITASGNSLFAFAKDCVYVSTDIDGTAWTKVVTVNIPAYDKPLFASGSHFFDADVTEMKSVSVSLLINVNRDSWLALPKFQADNIPAFRLHRLSTSCIDRLRTNLVQGGLDKLLSLQSQSLAETTPFAQLKATSSVQPPYPADSMDFDLSSPYALYFREIFFHIPYLIGDTLKAHQQFVQAKRWYEYIFNPTQRAELPVDNLVACWPLTAGSENPDNGLADQAGKGASAGTLHGFGPASMWVQADPPTPFSGRCRLLQFNGRDDYIEAMLPPGRGLSAFTLAAWVWQDEDCNGTILSIGSADDAQSGGLQFGLQARNGQLLISSSDRDSGDVAGRHPLSPTQWHHVALTCSGSGESMKLYVDGMHREAGLSTSLSSYVVDLSTVSIGYTSSRNAQGGFFKGKIAQVAVWAGVLTQNQICLSVADRYWQYRPFRYHTLQRLQESIGQSQQIHAYQDDPFDPFAIAQFRLGAYEKAVVMAYIDNLLAWGDSLYAMDGWENLNAATTLYVLAAELLGPRPAPSQPYTQTNVRLTAGDAHGKPNLHRPQFDLADLLMSGHAAGDDAWTAKPFFDVPEYFFLPENDQFAGYWNKVEQRLYQIRHCMNLQGVVRQLPLFQPPIDPRQLIRALAAGRSIASVTRGAAVQVPHYRFAYLLERARQVTSELKQLGSALLSALEKQDAEQLAVLRNTYEGTTLTLTTLIKQKQQEEIQHNLAALQQSLAAAGARHERYQSWATQRLSPGEQAGLSLTQTASGLREAASLITNLSGIAYAIPNIYGLADGGANYGKAVEVGAGVFNIEASILEWAGQMALSKAVYDRRQADWQLQAELANYDVQQINAQIEALNVHQAMVDQELAIHQQSITQNQKIDQLYRQKFTSQELYQWMIGRLAGIYFQTYQLASDLARMTERAFQFERNTDVSYLNANGWDGLRKGLLAGEALELNLNQLEKAYIEQNFREFEIEKTISLLHLNPLQLLSLKRNGKCTFDLTEQLFDYDFPGHYCRRIKSVSISIPAVVGPYQNIQATLTQNSDRVLLKADSNAVMALLSGGGLENLAPGVLRSNWRAHQQIALSRGSNDSGMFQLDFRDERYLPFEGTGAVSSWELSLPKGANRNLDFASISDVIVNLRYTALDGGAAFRQQVIGLDQIKKYSGHHLLSLRQEFPAVWQTAAAMPAADGKLPGGLEFELGKDFLPKCFGTLELDEITTWVWPKKADTLPEFKLKANRVPPQQQSQVGLAAPPLKWSIDVTKQQLDEIEDILLLIPYSGELDWVGS